MILDRHWQTLKAAQPKLVNDLPSDISLSDDDVKTIAEALNKSKWLRANIRSLYKLYKWLPRLASGYYDDFTDLKHDQAPPGVIYKTYTDAELDALFIHINEED